MKLVTKVVVGSRLHGLSTLTSDLEWIEDFIYRSYTNE